MNSLVICRATKITEYQRYLIRYCSPGKSNGTTLFDRPLLVMYIWYWRWNYDAGERKESVMQRNFGWCEPYTTYGGHSEPSITSIERKRSNSIEKFDSYNTLLVFVRILWTEFYIRKQVTPYLQWWIHGKEADWRTGSSPKGRCERNWDCWI